MQGNLHVRFGEGDEETCSGNGARRFIPTLPREQNPALAPELGSATSNLGTSFRTRGSPRACQHSRHLRHASRGELKISSFAKSNQKRLHDIKCNRRIEQHDSDSASKRKIVGYLSAWGAKVFCGTKLHVVEQLTSDKFRCYRAESYVIFTLEVSPKIPRSLNFLSFSEQVNGGSNRAVHELRGKIFQLQIGPRKMA